jgi:D-amino peptidase
MRGVQFLRRVGVGRLDDRESADLHLGGRLARSELCHGADRSAGLADGADAALFIGYHGEAGTPRSVLAHTIHGGVFADVRCDGRSLGEIGLNAALAAHSGVPAVLVSGDETVAAEATAVVPGVHTVVVKRAIGSNGAALLHPDEACERIQEEVPRELADRVAVRPLLFDGPIGAEVDVLLPGMTERAVLIPGIERVGGCTLRYAAPDFPTACRVIQLIIMLGGI